MRKLDSCINLLENPIISGIFLIIVLILAYYFVFNLWTYIFTAFLTYFVADILVRLLVAGGGGIFQFRPLGNETTHYGHALLIFSGVIIFSSFISAWASDSITKKINMDNTNFWSVFIPVAILVILIFVNMFLTYFKRK